MGNVARRRLAVLVPWVALVAVTVFALVRLGHRTEVPPPAPEPRPGPELGTPVLETAAQAAEQALDQALVDLEGARREAADARRVAARTAGRLEAREAALAVAEARLAAGVSQSASQIASQAEACDRLRKEVAALEVALAKVETEAKDPVRDWLADAGAKDPRRRAAARAAATTATPEQVARLGALLDEDPGRAAAVAWLVGGMKAGSTRDALAVRILAGPILREGTPEVVAEVVALLAGREIDWPAGARTKLAKDLVGGSDVAVSAVRAVGVLALEGVAPHLLELGGHRDPAMRAAAIHALSRVPDREAVREELILLLPAVLGDDDVRVRTAAVLLAEALLAEGVDFDPAAGEAARRAQLEKLMDRLVAE